MNTFVIYKNCICRGLNPACERCGGFCATEKVVVKEFNVKKSSRKAINSNEIVTTSNYPNCDYFFKKPELKKCQLCGKEHENFFRFSQKGVYCKFCKTKKKKKQKWGYGGGVPISTMLIILYANSFKYPAKNLKTTKVVCYFAQHRAFVSRETLLQ